MSTLRVNTLQDATGSNQPAMAGAAKAWVNFNGEGTVAIRQAFNVSSITDNGTGNYTVNFTNAMADANYATLVASMPWSSGARNYSAGLYGVAGTYSTTAVQLWVESSDGTTNDMDTICASVFR